MTVHVFDDPYTNAPRRALATIPIGAHLIIAFLSTVNRDVFQSLEWNGAVNQMIALIVDHPAWLPINLSAAFLLLLSRRPPQVIWAYSFSASALGVWGLGLMHTGLFGNHDVSLLGPSLVLLITGYTLAVARRWSHAYAVAQVREDV